MLNLHYGVILPQRSTVLPESRSLTPINAPEPPKLTRPVEPFVEVSPEIRWRPWAICSWQPLVPSRQRKTGEDWVVVVVVVAVVVVVVIVVVVVVWLLFWCVGEWVGRSVGWLLGWLVGWLVVIVFKEEQKKGGYTAGMPRDHWFLWV